MARPSTAGVDADEVPQFDFAEVLLALARSSLRRARLLVELGQDLIQTRRPPGEAVKRWVDGNESDLEELTLRWRLAGVRWPIVILLLLTFVAGYQAGRRASA
ncbi:MAG TPA: hypothetical protein VG370_18685 [Chloroflexota bacterium]|nr:hypothetical protein [Chloroflexota bacterium]